jgi:hypothetical protein
MTCSFPQERGRPAKYGLKYTPERVEELEETVEELWLYGKKQKIHSRSVHCLARFLKGRLIKVVWTQFEDSDGNLRKPRLLVVNESGFECSENHSEFREKVGNRRPFQSDEEQLGMA